LGTAILGGTLLAFLSGFSKKSVPATALRSQPPAFVLRRTASARPFSTPAIEYFLFFRAESLLQRIRFCYNCTLSEGTE
jgi:hypothetical protein